MRGQCWKRRKRQEQHENISKSHGRADDRRDHGRDLICWTSISADRDMLGVKSDKNGQKGTGMIKARLTLRDALDIMAGGYRLEISDGKIRIIKEGEEC